MENLEKVTWGSALRSVALAELYMIIVVVVGVFAPRDMLLLMRTHYQYTSWTK